jgi:TetR/AcrR family transcriptional repressor of nem operon
MAFMKDTKEHILDVTQELIQTRGYSSISFQDIADIVGIKKPSIIYHFPSKAALGKAVLERYHLYFKGAMQGIIDDPDKNSWDSLEFYFTPYLDFGCNGDKICLAGALASEFTVVGEEIQEELKKFFGWHYEWMVKLLKLGKESGEFNFEQSPDVLASSFLCSLQGALIVKRVTGDDGQLVNVVECIRSNLK